MKLLPWPDQISAADYVALVLKLTAALGAYGALVFGLGEQIVVLTFATLGLPMLVWAGMGFVVVPYLSTKLLVLGATRVPRVAALSLLVPLVGLLVTPVGSNLDAYGVPVPWLSMHRPMSASDLTFVRVQGVVTTISVLGALGYGCLRRGRER